MKALFCTDGSRISYESLANFLFWVKDPIIDVMCVADWSFLPDSVSVEGSDFAVKCANSVDSVLEYADKFIHDNNGILGQKIKTCGIPVDEIIDTEDQNEYDYIILGSNGKKGFQKWLGSVSQEIASSSKTSTYVSKGLNSHKRILFTLDNSELSANVILQSLNNIDFDGKEVSLLTVYEVPDYMFLEGNIDSNWALDIEKKQNKEGNQLLDKFEHMFTNRGINVTTKEVLRGIPAQVIVDYANKNYIDLVVTGVRNKKYFSKFFLGSVSKRVLEHVTSDVLIVRP